MPRTPLLRAFQRLAAEHRAAERLGVPPAELRDGRFSRAEFLKRAGATGAVAVAAPTLLAQRASAIAAPRIAIVGGGISGLTAALTLADAGVGSTIYEASAHVGGRMHSDRSGYWADRQVSEFCGELIDSGHQTIRDLARRFHLKKVDLIAAQPHGTTDTYSFFGDYYSVERADADFDGIRPALDAQTEAAGYPTTWDSSTPTGRDLDHMSVYDWIERYVPGGHHRPLGRLLDVAYAGEYGADTRDQASLNLVYLLGFQPHKSGLSIFGESDERFHIDGGNEQLPEAIAAALPRDAINLGWSMQAIRANAERHRLDDLRDARPDEDGHRRPGHPRAPVRRAAQPRLRRAPASTPASTARSPRWARGATRSSSCSSPAATGTRGPVGQVQRQRLLRRRRPEHVGGHARRSTARRASSSSTPAGASRRASSPRRRTRTPRPTRRSHLREDVPDELEKVFPGISKQWTGQGDAVDAVPRPAAQLLVLLLAPRPVHVVRRLRGRGAGQHPLRRRAQLAGLPGLHGRRRERGRPRGEEVLAAI